MRHYTSEDSADSDGRIAYLVERQRDYTLIGDKGHGPAELVTNPLSRWSNPISGANGAIFVWTLDGRPAALTKVHVNDRKRNYVESTIALVDGLTMTQGGRTIWDPSEPTLEMITVSDVQGLANLKSGRLLQMRRLAESLDVQDS